jgi:hypothetical protein
MNFLNESELIQAIYSEKKARWAKLGGSEWLEFRIRTFDKQVFQLFLDDSGLDSDQNGLWTSGSIHLSSDESSTADEVRGSLIELM